MSKTKERLLDVAAGLFASRGFEGTSVRALCSAADANVNAVSYHFGGKKALYTAVIQRMGDRRLESAQRILGLPPRDLAELETRLLLFAEETLVALLQEPELLIILVSEMQQGFRNCGHDALSALNKQREVLIGFLEAARSAGLLRAGVNTSLVAGGLFERLNNQVMYADNIHAFHGQSIKEPKYRRRWTREIIHLLLFGAANPASERA